MTRVLKITYNRDTSGGWKASILVVPGCHAEGDTQVEARTNIRAAFKEFFDEEDVEFIEEIQQFP
jgi:predicted RNase H-like HicB family nuclease